MPCLGRIPFLHFLSIAGDCACTNVSMPCLGRIPFLLWSESSPSEKQEMCQCPVSGESHFYAFFGSDVIAEELCQCPVSGESHFYLPSCLTQIVVLRVSMPCLGRIPFLLGLSFTSWRPYCCVSMPCLGRIPFLPAQSTELQSSRTCVNALSRANPISTTYFFVTHKSVTGVNALSRANPISTGNEKESCNF